MAVPRVSVFRFIAETVNAKIAELLTTEERQVPAFRYGADKFKEGEHDVRVRWFQKQGSIVQEPKVGATKTPSEAAPPAAPLFVRRVDAHVWMQHAGDEDVEHLLETLIRATQRTDFARYFHWPLAHYDFPTQVVGEELQNGAAQIRLVVPLDIQVNAETDDQFIAREVLSDKLQAGLVANLADDLDPDDRAVAEWTG